QSKMLTLRICCCSAKVTSRVFSLISIAQCLLFGIGFWFPITKWSLVFPLYLVIDQTVMAVLSIAAGVCVFVG
ncbi:hypothetical protein PENTCL1PPCAC_15558, partial [Pristionchus entomophagus]